ncbi:MAG: tyrosine--tRNA ligase [Christensenellales bacterium]
MDKKDLFKVLQERGYIYQATNLEEIEKMLTTDTITAYVGIDPTADSLHIGHCFPLIIAKYLQEAGHKIIIVLGGATAKIGDPSGKSTMRKMVTDEFVNNNYAKIKQIVGRFVDLEGENKATIVNNAEWFKGYEYVSFMRDIGVHFNVSKMLASDAYQKRIQDGGLTFFEMGYMLMQAYDFAYLNKTYGCTLEFGGSDQWGNIVAGKELARKLNFKEGIVEKPLEGFTHPLLTNYEGVKMGKTEKGALWVDASKTTPFEFYQYFYNIDDRDVEKVMKLLTRIPISQIKEYLQGDIRQAKRVMAYEITKLVHGKIEADKALEMANNIFANSNFDNMPSVNAKIDDEISVLDLLMATKLFSSKGEARRMIEQGAITIDDEKITDCFKKLAKKDEFVVKKGKKTFVKVVAK